MPSRRLGWATITHPFHPLSGQRAEVLKIRRAGGLDTLIVRDAQHGSIAIARDWTDWSLGEPVSGAHGQDLQFSGEKLLELAEFIGGLSTRQSIDLDERVSVNHAQTS
ncbi:hypothetical protein CKO25_20455 [Thiocapsa imhoffii]|uniref:Uncharacterized protein n=2 Tax=Thiocapsa imhoffii TaxID=382777 RepID=A0A9X0WM99_9GAMM|nr:hypothetical protein [Thiocapsa imhoffii]